MQNTEHKILEIRNIKGGQVDANLIQSGRGFFCI